MDRPQMRRKSSASALLSFRSPSSASTNPMASTGTLANYPAPLAVSGFVASAASQSSTTAHSPDGMGSPGTSVTPTLREWDAQSATAYSEGHTPAPVGTGVGALDLWRDTMNKRIMTLTYLRSTHEGKMHWFNTIHLTRETISDAMNQSAHSKRAYGFAILAMSLASILDINPSGEYLKALGFVLSDYDSFLDETVKPGKTKRRNIFRTYQGKSKRTGGSEFVGAYYDGGDGYLLMPTVPFRLDYCQTLTSLCDILSETYQKIQRNLGPSMSYAASGERSGAQTPGPYLTSHPAVPSAAGPPQMFGPLGVITPYPGLSSLWPPGLQYEETPEQGLWQLAAGGSASINVSAPGVFNGPSASLSKDVEALKGIDARCKKVIASLVKELDGLAKIAIKGELESLDPLLKNNLVLPDGGGGGGEEYEGGR